MSVLSGMQHRDTENLIYSNLGTGGGGGPENVPENVPEYVPENVPDNLADPMVCPKMCPICLTQFANIVPENVGSNGEPRNRNFTLYFSHFG